MTEFTGPPQWWLRRRASTVSRLVADAAEDEQGNDGAYPFTRAERAHRCSVSRACVLLRVRGVVPRYDQMSAAQCKRPPPPIPLRQWRPSSAQVFAAASTKAPREGDGVRSLRHDRATRRGGNNS